MEQHKFHSDKLEAILRLVDNSAVQFEKVIEAYNNLCYKLLEELNGNLCLCRFSR